MFVLSKIQLLEHVLLNVELTEIKIVQINKLVMQATNVNVFNQFVMLLTKIVVQTVNASVQIMNVLI